MIANDLLKYMSMDLPDIDEITDATREQNASRIFTGGVRINMGLYRTKEEDESYRKKILETKLPYLMEIKQAREEVAATTDKKEKNKLTIPLIITSVISLGGILATILVGIFC